MAPHSMHIVGDSWSGRAYELRSTLERCALPHRFTLADSPEGTAILSEAMPNRPLPVIVLPDGRAFADPSNAELARATGSPPGSSGEELDLVIVGAGPAGLSAAVYGASEGLRTMVVDRGGIGGQASSSASIRNYLGFPRGIAGSTLAQQAWEQAWILGARFVFMESVTELARAGDGLVVRVSDFGDVSARAVILATGAEYRRLGVPALEALSGAGVFYGGTASEAPGQTGSDVYVLGGANSAGTGRAPPRAVRAHGHARAARCVARAQDVPLPRPPARGDAERRGPARDRDRRRRRGGGHPGSSRAARPR